MDQKSIVAPFTCTYCGAWIGHETKFVIHRDGYDQGPEVPLCDACGCSEGPTCAQIWARISRLTAPKPKHLLN